MTKDIKPVLITCGEPAGIGPEIAVAAWQSLKNDIPMIWMGDPRHLPEQTPVKRLGDLSEWDGRFGDALSVLTYKFAGDARRGTADPANAAGVIRVIADAVALVQSGAASALCTAPIHKKALKDGADFAYPGHTEYLAALSGTHGRAVMMLASDKLRIVPATIHIPLNRVPLELTPALLRETIEITDRAMREKFGVPKPRLAIAGLNPHAGEGGAIGEEEVDWIADLLENMRCEGFDLAGPLPADTMFHAAARARYDAAIAMYHDQALIPIKTLDFDRGVNVTLGLPFVRTSPDHGTAFDIAGIGIANPTSMIEAIRLAAKMASASA